MPSTPPYCDEADGGSGGVESPETRETTFVYKATVDTQNGLLDKVIDPAGREIEFDYDDAGRVTAQNFVTDGRQVAFAYDPNGNLTALDVPAASAPAPRHGFAYTPVNLESTYTPPDSDWPGDGAAVPTGYSYNLTRELTRIDRPETGQQVDFDYDGAKGRLDRITLPSAEEVEYSYFASGADEGRLQSVTTADAVLSFSYDGSLLTAEQWSGGVSGTVTHGYDDRLQTASLQVNALPEMEFGYDLDGLLIQAGELELTRDGDTGFLTATALPQLSPQVTDTTTYSAFAELASYTATYPGDSYSYTIDARDKLGRITEKTETIGGVTTVYEYTYDAAGRLEEVTVDASVAADLPLRPKRQPDRARRPRGIGDRRCPVRCAGLERGVTTAWPVGQGARESGGFRRGALRLQRAGRTMSRQSPGEGRGGKTRGSVDSRIGRQCVAAAATA